jgi:hypothetical protein
MSILIKMNLYAIDLREILDYRKEIFVKVESFPKKLYNKGKTNYL